MTYMPPYSPKDLALSGNRHRSARRRRHHWIFTAQDPNVRYKADRSPVTDADQASEDIILEALSKLAPGIPAAR